MNPSTDREVVPLFPPKRGGNKEQHTSPLYGNDGNSQETARTAARDSPIFACSSHREQVRLNMTVYESQINEGCSRGRGIVRFMCMPYLLAMKQRCFGHEHSTG
jgi:hypothetical protein